MTEIDYNTIGKTWKQSKSPILYIYSELLSHEREECSVIAYVMPRAVY